MTNRIRTRIFLLVILVGSGLGVKAQSWDWNQTFPISQGSAFHPADSTLYGNSVISDYKEIEVMDIAPGSDGRLYSCGLFWGKQANFGSLSVHADTLLPSKNIRNRSSPIDINFQTAFLACQNPNGEYVWVKTLTGSENYDCNPWTGYRDRRGLYKLCLGPDGSIYAAGNSWGDSLNYAGTPIFNSNTGNSFKTQRNFVILKVDQNGTRIWHRTFPYDIPTDNLLWYNHSIFPRYFQFGLSGPELLLNGNAKVYFSGDSTTWSGPLYVSLSEEGQIAQVRKESGVGQPFLHFFHSLTRRLKDKRWLVGYSSVHMGPGSPTPGFTGFDIYSPDFSQKLHRISFQTRGMYSEHWTGSTPLPSDTAEFFLQQVWDLPDGNLGLVLGNMSSAISSCTYSNLSLIVNADTLDISPYFQPGNNTRSLFIKVNQEGCMKQIEPLSYFMLGDGVFTENGHLLTCRQDTLPLGFATQNSPAKLLLLSKNGHDIAQTALGDNIAWPKAISDDILFLRGVNSNPRTFQIRTAPTGNKAWICAGNFVGQFTYPDPVLGDESAAGCLRGNAITATRDVQKQDLFLSQSQNGVEIRATDNQAGRYRILGSDGRLLEEGSWKGSQTPIGHSIGAKGIYQVMLSGSENPKTLRFVQY